MRGYTDLRGAAAWRDLRGRGRILAHGEDNARLLHAMSSNHVQGLAEGEGCYTFFLNAQGRIQADAHIFRTGTDILIDTEGVARDALFQHLDKYIIADDVTLEDLSQSHYSIGIEGPAAFEIGLPVPPKEYGILPYREGYLSRQSETGLPGLRLTLPLGVEHGLSLPEADEDAWETVRLEQGKPRFGVEILDRHLVQETRQMHAVHFSKGCYLGQEIVERVRARGQVHKGLAGLSIEGDAVPEAGTEVQSDGGKAGQILHARWSPAESRVVAIGMLSTDVLSEPKPLTVAGRAASLRAR